MESVNVRIAELSAIIAECLKDNSVYSAIIWANAIKERGELLSSLRSQIKVVHVNVNR